MIIYLLFKLSGVTRLGKRGGDGKSVQKEYGGVECGTEGRRQQETAARAKSDVLHTTVIKHLII